MAEHSECYSNSDKVVDELHSEIKLNHNNYT